MDQISFKRVADSNLLNLSENDESSEHFNTASSPSQLKGETVEKHPLARSSSNSSTSSTESDSNYGQLKISENKNPIRKTKMLGVDRLRGFLGRLDDNNKVEPSDGNVYYNLWHNKAKILTNLKKQATESVRSLTQSASHDAGIHQGIMYKSPDKSSELLDVSNVPALSISNSQSGLIKVSTDNIKESHEDNEINSFSMSLKEKEIDPLTAIKLEEENKEDLEINVPPSTQRARAFTSSAVTTPNTNDTKKHLESSRSSRSSSTSNSTKPAKRVLAVSLSSLIAGADQNATNDDDVEIPSILPKDETKSIPSTNLKTSVSPSKLNSSLLPISTENEKSKEVHEPKSESALSFYSILFLSMIVYFYLLYPLPHLIRLACTCFVFGCLFTATVLCIVASRSSRPSSFLPPLPVVNVAQPIPLSIYDPDQPIKGWMNEVVSYDPDTYHITNTHSVYVTLDGATLRLQTPQKSVARRSVYNEGSVPIINVIHQRLFDVTFAKVYLQPTGLVKKRVWSKKYPICVEIPSEKPTDVIKTEKSSKVEQNSSRNEKVNILYLFGRTCRQKEEWFYRIQRSISVALARHNHQLKTSKVKLTDSSISPLNVEDEWGIIDDYYEEETFVCSSVNDMNEFSNQPIRMLQDYLVHVSRLLPQINHEGENSSKHRRPQQVETSEKIVDSCMDEKQVSWLNVIVGRILFDFLRQKSWTKWLSGKIQKKLDKIKLPYFINGLKLTEINLGSTVPLVHEISLPKLDSQGIWFNAEVTYSGSAQMTLETKLVLTKLGKNETALTERYTYNRIEAATDSDAEDSGESSDDEQESAVSRIMGQVQNAVSKFDSQQLFKEAIKAVAKDPPSVESSNCDSNLPFSDPHSPTSSVGGTAPKKWIRIMDSITKSKYFQKATESDYIRKKLETVSNTPMLLTVELIELKGTLVVNIPPPPTDRVWYGFREPPLMHMKAQPKVGERVVKTSHVTDWIENKLQQEVTKLLVLPNMEDIPIPIMFHNRFDVEAR